MNFGKESKNDANFVREKNIRQIHKNLQKIDLLLEKIA